VVEVAGLDRGPERGLGDELQSIAQALQHPESKKPDEPTKQEQP
jgi:cytochrome c biogenesis protein